MAPPRLYVHGNQRDIALDQPRLASYGVGLGVLSGAGGLVWPGAGLVRSCANLVCCGVSLVWSGGCLVWSGWTRVGLTCSVRSAAAVSKALLFVAKADDFGEASTCFRRALAFAFPSPEA